MNSHWLAGIFGFVRNIPPKTRLFGELAAGVIALGILAGCASPPSSAPRTGGYTSSTETAGATRPESRPGLGTGWGEERDSRVTSTRFVRSNSSRPNGADAVYYNDREGIEAMIAHEGGARRSGGGLRTMASGLVSVGVKGSGGGYLDGYFSAGKRFIVGERGGRYEIVVRNESGTRAEVVLSVDGLDVIDGRSASVRKNGYVLDPGETLVADGFRTSDATVAAFRFSSVDRSYAALRHGDTRNVGVIGVAVFTEKNRDQEKRRKANPFPGSRYAVPPEG